MAKRSAEEDAFPTWTFLTNHAHVIVRISAEPMIRIRDLAEEIGITERGVLRIVGELEAAGYLSHEREGRRNVYVVHRNKPLRHPIERHRSVGDLLDALADKPRKRSER
jgi:DNA-binding MarR family transcriptional regulator